MTGALCIDTVSDTMVVAFGARNAEPRVLAHDESREHTRALLRLIDEVCEGNRRAIDTVVVVRGPGAYAGLRVGVATAQSLGLALGVPVSGVTTFEAAHEAARRHPGFPTSQEVTGIHPAGRGEFSVQSFLDGTPRGDSHVLAPGDLPVAGVFGEGAGAIGGIEVGPRERCLAALALHARGATSDASALYVREPHITTPKPAVRRG